MYNLYLWIFMHPISTFIIASLVTLSTILISYRYAADIITCILVLGILYLMF